MENKKKNENTQKKPFLESLALAVTKATGSNTAIILAFLTIIVWALFGPFLKYSENWQLVINTGTTIITFLMVFLIQKAQNKDSIALHIKLDEIIRSHDTSSNLRINVENMTEEELETIQKYYRDIRDDNQCNEEVKELKRQGAKEKQGVKD